MTWKELAEKIANMSEDQKRTDVTLYDHENGEFCALLNLHFTDKDEDRLDPGHPYLTPDTRTWKVSVNLNLEGIV